MAEEKEVAVRREPRQLAQAGFAFLPKTWEELYAYAKEIAQTDFVPNDLRGKPGAVLACWQFGQEVGLAPMAALQSIAVINGRPSLWGDGALAVVRANPLCEYVRELRPDEALKAGYGECTVKRRDDDVPIMRRFTKEEAEVAGLWGGKSTDAAKAKLEPWSKYPGRMLQMRARAWAMRDAIPEALRGISIREEVEDMEPRDVTPEPLKIPQPLREVKDEPQKTGLDAAHEMASEQDQQEDQSTDAGAQSADSGDEAGEKQDNPPQKKSIEEIALAEIAGYSKDTFPNAKDLNKYLKGQSGKVQARICQAFNDRRKELGL